MRLLEKNYDITLAKMQPKHFAGLDGLRFISITFVILHHLFTFKQYYGFVTYDYPILGLIGLYGIHFFFMGSGFLITYLLLYEYKVYGKINLKNFFLRRILRIWPAYYLLIIIFLLVFNNTLFRIPGLTDQYLGVDTKFSNIFYLAFIPQIQPFFFPTAPFIHHTYTIGIEEQFYLIWGLLFYFFRKHILLFFILIIIFIPLFNILHEFLYAYVKNKPDTPVYLNHINSLLTYIQYSRFSTFAIGSIFGYAYFYNHKWIQYFKKIVVQLIVYIILVSSLYFKISIPYLQFEYMALIMACIMSIATFKKESFINYNLKWISYLGKISYGIYLFHIFAIVFACEIISFFTKQETGLFVLLILCLLTLILSIFFGWLSYHFFEIHFLKIKRYLKRV